ADNTAGIIADWDEAGIEPPKFAVEASQTCFVMERNTDCYRSLKNFEDPGKVFRMDDIYCSPVLQLFRRPAKIIEHLAIDGFEFTIWGRDCNETWDSVNGRTQTLLAFAQGLFRTFALGDVNCAGKTPGSVFSRISQRELNIEDGAIESAQTGLG